MKKISILAIAIFTLLITKCQSPAATSTPKPTPSATPNATGTPAPSPTPTQTHTPTPTCTATPDQPDLVVLAESVALIDAQTGELLYQKDPHAILYPASTTKIMTALLAVENLDLNANLTIGDDVNQAWYKSRLDSQKAGLQYDETISIMELLYALLLPSGSDAAFVIAGAVARKVNNDPWMPTADAIQSFIRLMNQRADEIGAKDTHFANPDGYQDPEHVSTAYDMALIAREAMQNDIFRQIVATSRYDRANRFNQNSPAFWENTNELIDPQAGIYYPPADGIKTGTSEQAGHCLVSSAVFGERRFIAVVFKSTLPGVWRDSIRLLEYAQSLGE